MNKTQKTLVATYAGVVAVKTVQAVLVIRSERKKREEISANLQKNLDAIHTARDEMIKNIQNGDYDGAGIERILENFKLHTMYNL